MHELSIAQSLIERVEELASREGAERVERVTVRVGALCGVDPEALGFVFPIAAEGTAAGGAQLTIERVPAAVRCRGCGRTCEPVFPFFLCGHCGSDDVEVTAGRELDLASVDVAVPEDRATGD